MTIVLAVIGAWCLAALAAATAWAVLRATVIRKHPAPANPPVPGTTPVPGITGTPQQAANTPQRPSPAPGHHRGGHLVVDAWECGCIYTWARGAGWVHDHDCLDEKLRSLLS